MSEKDSKSSKVQPTEVPSGNPKIKRLLLHQPFTINGVTDQALYDHKGFIMFYHSDGVYGEFKGFKFIVPLANVVCAYF